MGKNIRATIKDVAREAKVSIATVSYVLNGTRKVNFETASKIRQAIKKLSYRPNRIAQSLVTKSSRTIGVLISNISDSFFSPIVRGIEDVASQAKYVVMIGNSDENYLKATQYLEFIAQHWLDGLIISPTSNFDKLHKKLYDLDIPIILVNRRSEGLKVDVVETDNKLGTYIAIKHLISLNHSRIGLVSGPTNVSTYADRLQGYMQAFKDSGLPVINDLIRVGGYHYDSAYSLTNELLNLSNPPTALFVASGRLSRGAFQAIKELGLSLPEDLSFITFDETEWASLVSPPLTSVAQKTYKMGQTAATLLFERLNKEENIIWPLDSDEPIKKAVIPPRIIKIEPEFLVRSSTGITKGGINSNK